jgi:GNAT superfamily N-acetyltransferase
VSERPLLFCDAALARRIERAETELMVRACEAAGRRDPESGAFVLRIAGGAATFAEPGSPFDKVAGLGFDGLPGAAALDEVERAFAARGAPVQIELAHLADPALAEQLTARGYRLVGFENVLGRGLVAGEPGDARPGIEVRPIGDGELDRWLGIVVDAVADPDPQGAPGQAFADEVVDRAERDLVAAGVVPYIALRDGAVAGGASIRMWDGVAQLTGAATAPAHRRRGVHGALLAARLADAAAAGCDIAVVTVQPASTSQRNVQSRGFDLLYTRAVLVKPHGRRSLDTPRARQ